METDHDLLAFNTLILSNFGHPRLRVVLSNFGNGDSAGGSEETLHEGSAGRRDADFGFEFSKRYANQKHGKFVSLSRRNAACIDLN